MKPHVWTVIPTRGRKDWITRQLAALVQQLVEGDAVVVVVDEDAEAERAVREQYADAIKAGILRVVGLSANVGVDAARRIGNAFVPSDAVLCEVDDHDIVEPCFRAAVADAFADKEVLMAYADVYHTDAEGKVKELRVKDDGPLWEGRNRGWGFRAYRKWVYDAIGGRPEGYWPANDYAQDLMMGQLVGPERVRHIRRPVASVLQDKHGISKRLHVEQEKQTRRAATAAARREFRLPFRIAGRSGVQASAGPKVMRGVRAIPRLVHFIWVGPQMPEWARANIARFKELNPECVFLTHGDEVLLDKWRAAYEQIVGGHQWSRRSDILRVSALVKFGGWYFDCDFYPLRPLSDVYDAHSNFPAGCFLTQGTPELVANGIIGAALNADFLRLLEAQIDSMLGEDHPRSWDAYGPRLYTQMAAAHPATVQIGALDMFYPFQGRGPEARAWYKRTVADFSYPKIAADFAGRSVPYMVHLDMQERLEL